jgi:hypothetical protein
MLFDNKYQILKVNFIFLLTHVTEGGSDPVGSKKFRLDPTEFLSDSLQSDSDPDFVGIRRNMIEIRLDPTRVSSGSVEIRVGIRQKLYRIRSVFYEKCRIPMKSDADPIENDRICRSD